MKNFERLHPLILFYYFFVVIFITFMTMNPFILSLSYASSILFCILIHGIRKILKSLLYSIPLLILIAISNPLFVHKGATVLFFLNDNPVTKEALIYGVFIGVLFMSVFYWFKAYNQIMTSDKFVFLFGKAIPRISLLLSMILGFIPKLSSRYKEINESQKALGMYTSKSYLDKIRSKMRSLTILISWSLESSIDTADSMQARGYSLKDRTSYSLFKWTRRDSLVAVVMLILSSVSIFFILNGDLRFNFYPVMDNFINTLKYVITYISIFALMLLCTIIEIKEKIAWQYYQSKI